MSAVPAHPMMQSPSYFVFHGKSGSHLRAVSARAMGHGTMGGVFSNITDSIGDALGAIVQTISNVVAIIANIIKSVVEALHLAEILQAVYDLGKPIVQWIADKYVKFNPIGLSLKILKENFITRNIFRELDKYSGGFLTNAMNVSTLPGRALRGDHIDKRELIMDALFAIQVAALIIGGPMAAGALVGGWVGNYVCQDLDTKDARNVCKGAFIIAAAATAQWYADSEMFTGWAAEEADALLVSDYLLPATTQYFMTQGVDYATNVAIQECQEQNWMGDDECRILGQIANAYVKSPEGEDWVDFMATQLAAIGIIELAQHWFPPNSPEYLYIKRYRQQMAQAQLVQQTEKTDLRGMVLLAAGAAFIIFAGGMS